MKDRRVKTVWEVVDVRVHWTHALLLEVQPDDRHVTARRNVRHDAVVAAPRPVLQVPDVKSNIARTVHVDGPVQPRGGRDAHVRWKRLVRVRVETRARVVYLIARIIKVRLRHAGLGRPSAVLLLAGFSRLTVGSHASAAYPRRSRGLGVEHACGCA